MELRGSQVYTKLRLILAAIILFWLTGIPASAQAATGFSKIGNVTTLTFSDTSCPNQSTCYYQVTALDAQGFESSAAPCSTTQLCLSGNIAVAIMPSSGVHSVALAWTASTSTTVSYNVYRHIGPFTASNLSATPN